MTVLDEWPGKSGWKSTKAYPWEEWFDGKIRLLLAGKDYRCRTQSFVTLVYENAKKRELRVRVQRETDVDGVTIQVKPPDDDEYEGE